MLTFMYTSNKSIVNITFMNNKTRKTLQFLDIGGNNNFVIRLDF